MPPAFATSTYHPSHPSHGHSYRVKSSGPWAFLRARAAARNAQSCLQSCSCAGTGAFSHPTQRLQTGLLFLPLIQMPHPVGPLLTLVLTVCLLRFAAKRIGSPCCFSIYRLNARWFGSTSSAHRIGGTLAPDASKAAQPFRRESVEIAILLPASLVTCARLSASLPLVAWRFKEPLLPLPRLRPNLCRSVPLPMCKWAEQTSSLRRSCCCMIEG